ncbi:hypothetical protein IFM89_009820 [Coptis chinensis]|uniref:Uncharacterized protein n=1 Tax=Coptis chinensis TaxID=261450 RepID=A0A835LZ42_9MAGN|nr:hypothetical protein IFM89_009820 [Coptis chinensis]
MLTQIYEKETLALSVHTRYEAREIQKEVRADVVTFIHLQSLFFIPCYTLSLLALMMTVNATALAYNGKQLDFIMAVKAVMLAWKRQLVTSGVVYVIVLTYCILTRVILILVGDVYARMLVWILLVVLEGCVLAILGMGMVVSVLEEECGLEALGVGWVLMEGRWFCGWILASLLVMMTSGIRWGFRILMGSQDLMSLVNKVGLICILGLVILWSYVVNTVFYCECKKEQVDKVEN